MSVVRSWKASGTGAILYVRLLFGTGRRAGPVVFLAMAARHKEVSLISLTSQEGIWGQGVPGEAVTSVALLLTPAAPLLPPCCTCGRFAVSSFLGVLPPAFRGDDELATADCCVERAIMDCSLTCLFC